MVGTWGLALQEEHKVMLGNRDPHVLVPFPWHYEIRHQVKGRAGILGRPDTLFYSLRKTKIWKRVMMLTWEGGICLHPDTVGVFQVPGSACKRFLSFLGSEDASPAGGTGAVAHRGSCCHLVHTGWAQGSVVAAGHRHSSLCGKLSESGGSVSLTLPYTDSAWVVPGLQPIPPCCLSSRASSSPLYQPGGGCADPEPGALSLILAGEWLAFWACPWDFAVSGKQHN